MFQSSSSVIGHLSGQSLSFSFPGANAHGTGAGQRVAYAHHSVRIVNPVCQNITGTVSQRSSILLGRPPSNKPSPYINLTFVHSITQHDRRAFRRPISTSATPITSAT